MCVCVCVWSNMAWIPNLAALSVPTGGKKPEPWVPPTLNVEGSRAFLRRWAKRVAKAKVKREAEKKAAGVEEWLPADYALLGRGDGPVPRDPPPPEPPEDTAAEDAAALAWLLKHADTQQGNEPGFPPVPPPVRGPWVGKHIYVAQTTLTGADGKRLKQWGVFSSRPVRAGQYICTFTGNFMPKSKFESRAKRKPKMRRHAVELDFDSVGNDKEESVMLYTIPEEEENFASRHVAQCLNEPPLTMQANVKFFQHQYADVEKNKFVSAVLVYAAEPVPADTELFLHYGAGYDEERKRNKYQAGDPAAWPEKLEHTPPMHVVIQAILERGERLEEIVHFEDTHEAPDEAMPQGTRSRPRNPKKAA